jgi:hypothetical protein
MTKSFAHGRASQIASTEETISINVNRLTTLLEQLRETDSLDLVQRSVRDMQQRLQHADSGLRCANGAAALSIGANYLQSELEQIAAARSLDRAGYYIERLIRALTEVRTSPINDINLNRWKEYDDILTDSLWLVERRDNSGIHNAGYWGNFIPQIPNQLLRRYTRRGDWVLDPFAGWGTTLIEAQRLGRNSLGLELQPAVAAKAREMIAAEANESGVVTDLRTADSSAVDYPRLLRQFAVEQVQMLIMHPPYFDIIRFSDDPRDLSNAASLEQFLAGMEAIVQACAAVLERGRYLALVIGDKYARGEWIPLGFETMQVVLHHGFTLKSIVVKNFEGTAGKRSQKELWKYRALVGGFFVFKHEYIFILRKR